MPSSFPFYLVCIMAGIVLVHGQGGQLTVSTEPPIGSCEPITAVSMCLSVGWDNASFPNLREHATQVEAQAELSSYAPLVALKCSNAIVHFLCSVYAPFCFQDPKIANGRPVVLKPCRESCQHVRDGCEPVLVSNQFRWPSHLDCDNFPPVPTSNPAIEDLCFNINVTEARIPSELLGEGSVVTPSKTSYSTVSATSTSSMSTSRGPSQTSQPIANMSRDSRCPQSLALASDHPFTNSSYVFADIKDCAVTCEGVYFSSVERNTVAPVFILICAILCIGFTLFTVGTFLIDRQRYHYPERPVIFLAQCYLVLSFAFVVGAVVKLRDAEGSFACSDTSESDKSFIFQRLPNSTPTYRSASCVILFIIIYYFQMAAALWWVILTLTWFMASTLKWGEEAVERPWIFYHILAWSLPALQVILILALQLVDGDQLSGTCFTGNYHHVGLGVFVLLPLIVYLILGIVFLVIGFMSLVLILRQISQDPHKSKRLTRLIIRIFIYGLLYVIPNIIYICLCIYEVANRSSWEESQLECHGKSSSECSSSPQFAALIIRYVMLFVIGIFSTFWVISWKTLVAWRKFFASIFFCHQEQQFIPNKKETAI